ncbi:class I SAM-dependent methyltransferase [Desulforhopalus singaporensis]|uniref:Methyltransferase domain-containing protein n=1 Tax=Desulforhopalus singaporensis TaxID=91360 RepID=A0A1H0QWL5_9BACT|nr:class I SAM-dependent methyltransferase [Desulforhopalus singaporensis]SDP21654.1 Methyltransferase domain-containing protein [Desulforhopalus singaporensis]
MFLETADIETASAGYAERFSGQAGEYFLEKQEAITLALLQDLSGARILDVGGGHAQLAEPLVAKGFEVTVTGSDDICRKRLDQRIGSSNFTYLTCDCLNLPYEDNAFDVVISFRLLPHAQRWQELLAELCRVADRCVICDYPDRRSVNILYEHLFAMKKKMEGNTRPYTLFSRGQMAQVLERNGFGAPLFKPEFLLPMVIHRKLNNKKISSLVENCLQATSLTHFFGSPIIFRSDRLP